MRFLILAMAVVLPALPAAAQTEDPLAYTLPSGKVVHFQSAEQKDAFVASRERMHHAAAQAASPTPVPAASPSAGLGHTALDDKPAASGKVNVNAPTFTAHYYMFAPETWVGKKVTLSVGYLQMRNEAPRADGMRRFEASTYGVTQFSGSQDFGGSLTILAAPAAADRIVTLCGTTIQYNGNGMKMSLLHGEFQVLNADTTTGRKTYGLIVTE